MTDNLSGGSSLEYPLDVPLERGYTNQTRCTVWKQRKGLIVRLFQEIFSLFSQSFFHYRCFAENENCWKQT